MSFQEIAALVIFLLVILGVLLLVLLPVSIRLSCGQWGSMNVSLSYCWVPVVGVLAMLATRAANPGTLAKGIIGDANMQPYGIVILFLAVAYISTSLDMTGVFAWLALHITRLSKGHGMVSNAYGEVVKLQNVPPRASVKRVYIMDSPLQYSACRTSVKRVYMMDSSLQYSACRTLACELVVVHMACRVCHRVTQPMHELLFSSRVCVLEIAQFLLHSQVHKIHLFASGWLQALFLLYFGLSSIMTVFTSNDVCIMTLTVREAT